METIGYAIDFRNMSTAVHGLICFQDEQVAELALQVLERLDEVEDQQDVDDIVMDVMEDADLYEEYGLREIDWRDIYRNDADGGYYYDVTDDERVMIVNEDGVSIDLYL